jgi:hypothetical protein
MFFAPSLFLMAMANGIAMPDPLLATVLPYYFFAVSKTGNNVKS